MLKPPIETEWVGIHSASTIIQSKGIFVNNKTKPLEAHILILGMKCRVYGGVYIQPQLPGARAIAFPQSNACVKQLSSYPKPKYELPKCKSTNFSLFLKPQCFEYCSLRRRENGDEIRKAYESVRCKGEPEQLPEATFYSFLKTILVSELLPY